MQAVYRLQHGSEAFHPSQPGKARVDRRLGEVQPHLGLSRAWVLQSRNRRELAVDVLRPVNQKAQGYGGAYEPRVGVAPAAVGGRQGEALAPLELDEDVWPRVPVEVRDGACAADPQ